ncbi:MAG: hypothetical protein GEU73_14570 [Chloroflexi bacterium]|nr:hypothetical protein [Chloroflexota bacterium]
MNDSLPKERAGIRPAGLFDTLQAGFTLINRHAWLLAVPIAVDLVLWLGPQVTAEALLEPWLARSGAALALQPGVEGAVQGALVSYSLLSLLAVPLLGVPSVRAGTLGIGPIIPIDTIGVAAVVAAGAILVGVGIGALFYGLLGQVVREGQARPYAFLPDLGDLYVWSLGLFGLFLAAFLVGGIPLGLLVTTVDTVSPTFVGLLAPVLLGLLVWVFIYLFFTVDALFVSRIPPLSAARKSIQVVRHNFWSSLGLIGLILVISSGFPILWTALANNLRTPGTIAGIIGHSYLSAGLAAASMTYYKERFERIPQR